MWFLLLPWFMLVSYVALVQAASSAGRDVFALSKWADAHGIKMHDSLQWKEYGGGEDEASNWGLELSESVSPGTILLQVPRSLVLDSGSIRTELQSNRLDRALKKLGKFGKHEDGFLIFLKLLSCYKAGDDSRWSPWIKQLPKTYPCDFSAAERECLPFYAKYAADYQDKKFEAFCQAAAEMKDLDESVDVLRWAYHAVGSRFWTTEPLNKDHTSHSELVPVGDMFNHRHPPNVAITHDDGCVNFIYKGDPDESNKDLYITYGQPSNPHRFLATFGFVPADMTAIWSGIGYPDNPFSANVPAMTFGVDGEIPKIVWDAVLYALLQPSPALPAPEYTKEQHVKYKKHTAGVLATQVTKELEELVALRHKMDQLSGNSLHAIRQHNELITNVLSKVKARVDNDSDFSWD